VAAKRGRVLSEFGQAFTPMMVSGGTPPAVARPVLTSSWGVPTMQGYRDRTGKWNALVLPLLIFGELLKQLFDRWVS
jgi:hypothetical protein